MRVGAHRLREHIKFLSPLFVFIVAVWFLRLALDVAGAPQPVVRIFSLSLATPVSVLLMVLMMHVRRFGGYSSVVVSTLVLVAWEQLLIVGAIVFSVLTGMENIFTAPEFSVPGPDPHHLRHIVGHLTYGIGAGTLIGAAMGCLLLWLLRLLVPLREDSKDAQ
jgi:hypothetical protein